jgi:hypothetical protein
MGFKFINNVPVGIRPLVQDEIAHWIERADYPVLCGVRLPNGAEVDFCRRPWPPRADVMTTVGAERDSDEQAMEDFLNAKL